MVRTSNPFADLARLVLPEQTSGRLARIGGVDQRVAQRWISGDASVPDDIVQLLERQRRIFEAHEPADTDLKKVIGNWQAAGLHDEVIGSLLSAAYEELLQRRIR